MRLAKNRTEIEARAKSATVADLTLNEAAAVLMLTSDVRKLLNFARDCEHLSGEDLVQRCIEEGVAVIRDEGYDPFAGRTDAEKLELHLFTLFLSFDRAAGRAGGEPERVRDHVEWILQRPFQNVAEWLGAEGEKWRRVWGFRTPAMSEQFKADWAAFCAAHRTFTLADCEAKFDVLQRQFDEDRANGSLMRTGR
jgi:hypothetical protein